MHDTRIIVASGVGQPPDPKEYQEEFTLLVWYGIYATLIVLESKYGYLWWADTYGNPVSVYDVKQWWLLGPPTS